VTLHKRSERFGEEKETQCGKWRSRCPERLPRATSLHVYAEPDWDRLDRQGAPRMAEIISRSKFDDPSFKAPIYANLFDDEGEEIIPLAWRPRELAEDCRRLPCPVRLVRAP